MQFFCFFDDDEFLKLREKQNSVFARNGNNLDVSILNATDRLVIQNWYLGSQYQVEQFRYSDGSTLTNNQVASMASAMASFSAPAAVVSSSTARNAQWRHPDLLAAAV